MKFFKIETPGKKSCGNMIPSDNGGEIHGTSRFLSVHMVREVQTRCVLPSLPCIWR